MTLNEELASALAGMVPCHFPSLRWDRIDLPTNETYSTWMRLPVVDAQQESDSIAYGLLTSSRSHMKDGSPSTRAHLLRADFSVGTTLADNSHKPVSTPLTASDGEMVRRQFRQLEMDAGFRFFNTTLCLTFFGRHKQAFDNPFDSQMVLCIERDSSEALSVDHVKASLQYRTDLLDKCCAQRVLSTFDSILSTVANHIGSPLESVNLISPNDEQLINTWNANLPPPARQTLNEHFERTFRDNADKEAVYTSDGCFTYEELDDLTTVLAQRLKQLGLVRNSIVPICMNKSRWATCAMAAVCKAGGAITTLEPTYPDDRIFAIIEEVGARILISDTVHAARFERKAGLHVISDLENLPRLLRTRGLPIRRADAWRMADVRPADLAFVAFTSGSSGKPKGVMHTHDRLTSEHQSYLWNVEYNGGARILQFGSYAYIAGVGENFRSLLHGATLCVPSETERTSNLAEFINRSRSTRSYLTPSILRTIDPKDVPSLKHLCVGGEPLDRDLEKTWAGHVHFIQIYGASEGCFLIKEPGNPSFHGQGLLPVGGLSWLVDPQDVNKLVPIGAVGEIIFESHELAAGYLNDPEKTAQTFINPPVWAQKRAAATGCRYLRVGDLGRYEADGSVSIYGRADTQVKIHGQRVELGDIECHLRRILPPKSQAIVELVKPFDAPDRPLLTAFCRLELEDSGPNLQMQAIISKAQEDLEKSLPRHMIPRAFVAVKELPQSYKTDRRKLREDASKLGFKQLLESWPSARNEPLEPVATEKERILAELWARILSLDVRDIGRCSDFLTFGGDSLAAIRLVSAARSKNLGLTTQNVLAQPILKDMAELAIISNIDLGDSRALRGSGSDHDSSISNGPVIVRATDFQEWAAVVGALNGGWIDHLVYDFRGRLDLEKMERSCKRLVDSHAILKTVFRQIDGRVYMNIAWKQDLPFDLHRVSTCEVESKSNEIYATERISPLGRPIVRFDLIEASPTRHRLIMRLSHAQYDGFCAPTFGQHLRLLYFSQPLPPTLPFHEYARRMQDPGLVQDAELYWRRHLKGSQMPELVQRTSQSGPSHFNNALDGEFRSSVVEPNLRRHGISTAAVVKAAWALTISSLSRSSDVVFGDFIAGRQIPIPQVETVVGPCVNFMPVRVRVSPKLTKLELLSAVQADLISAIPHESLGFKHIIQHCTDWGRDQRFSSIVNFVNIGATTSLGTETWNTDEYGAGEPNPLEVDQIYEEQQHDKSDLWLLCRPAHYLASKQDSEARCGTKKMLDLYLRYATRVYQASAIERIASLFCQALDSLATNLLDAPVAVTPISGEEHSFLVPSI